MMATPDGIIGSNIPGVDVMDKYLNIYRQVDAAVASEVNNKDIAYICGRVTSEMCFSDKTKPPLPTLEKEVEAGDYIANPDAGRFYITVDTKGTLRWKEDSISFYPEHGNLHLIIIVNESTSNEYLAYLRKKKISYVIGGNHDVDLTNVLTKLKTNFHISTILLEGGGKMNESFLKAGLIDEIHLLELPEKSDEPGAPTLFDGEDTKTALSKYDLLETTPMPLGSTLRHYKKK